MIKGRPYMSGVDARETIEAEVRRELFGPSSDEDPNGKAVCCQEGVINFDHLNDAWGQFHEVGTGEEIITNDSPFQRYGIGVLHSGARNMDTDYPTASPLDDEVVVGLPTNAEVLANDTIKVEGSSTNSEVDDDDFDLTDANRFKPSAMAISFQVNLQQDGYFELDIAGAYYDRIKVNLPAPHRQLAWWVRRPIRLQGQIKNSDVLGKTRSLKSINLRSSTDNTRVSPKALVYSRKVDNSPASDSRLITVAIVNQNKDGGPGSALFQMGFRLVPRNGILIEPYPERKGDELSEEDLTNDLLYRNQRTYSIGHGCSAQWDLDSNGTVEVLSAVALPSHEVTSLTPIIYRADAAGNYVVDDNGARVPLTVSMQELSLGTAAGHAQMEQIAEQYANWIDLRKKEICDLPERMRAAAERHIQLASAALSRIREGLSVLENHSRARLAFQWANEAMLYQQIRSSFPLRHARKRRDGTCSIEGDHPEPVLPPGRGHWRPFQIAFILAVLPELVDPEHPKRDLVDLIFFPTGGGKTEAYLGASAISLLSRRLRNPEDSGTDTIMRYTLRLLTAQQFLRAASMICVLDSIRENNVGQLGDAPFGIGVWLGASSTPNTWKQAIKSLDELQRSSTSQNKFLLLRCPWCGAQMGPVKDQRGRRDVLGYEKARRTKVRFRCIDSDCKYSRRSGLPVHVVDEDIYEVRPSLIIGTVDKFAMLAWRPEARTVFGIDENGDQSVSPPNLIVQDEFHLISGPLGSMVGLYEPIIEELCTDRRSDVPVIPKIIAATATIRSFEDQVKGVFGRSRSAIFPPHGLEEGHSFFAEPSRTEEGNREPGRRYLGIMSSSFGSTQTLQTRVAAATLQGVLKVPPEDRDGYWTNLNFFNSLRELGNTVSLLESDMPDYLKGPTDRDGIEPRWPHHNMELTSRRRSDEIPEAIEKLQVRYDETKEYQEAVDVCLASNIIEVGVDIDRLALMTIVGQPKTTAQYIQVSGRVGRKPEVSPGLVLTIYGTAKPRDRSHYERFQTYHSKLYAQVEPTSVTPFAAPVLRRAFHAAVLVYIRQKMPIDSLPKPFPADQYWYAVNLLKNRAQRVDPDGADELDLLARKRALQWKKGGRTEWDANPLPWGDPKRGLMRFSGTVPDSESAPLVWDTPSSMRNVDAECRLAVTLDYNLEDIESEM